jgi:hypothetical protein
VGVGLEKIYGQSWCGLRELLLAQPIAQAPQPKCLAGQPAELASIYVQLAAEDASYTTGNIYGAGGGMGQP